MATAETKMNRGTQQMLDVIEHELSLGRSLSEIQYELESEYGYDGQPAGPRTPNEVDIAKRAFLHGVFAVLKILRTD